MIRFHCPGCAKSLKAPLGASGRKAKCQRCNQRFTVPATDQTLDLAKPPVQQDQSLESILRDLGESEKDRLGGAAGIKVPYGPCSCGLGLIACCLCTAAILIGVLYDHDQATASPDGYASVGSKQMPPGVKALVIGLYAAGLVIGLIGLAAGVLGLVQADGGDALCWLGTVLSALPLCLCAMVVLLTVSVIAVGLTAESRQRRVTIEGVIIEH